MRINDGVEYNEEDQSFNFNFDSDIETDVISLRKSYHNNRLYKAKDLKYFLSYRYSKAFKTTGIKDLFLRKLKSKKINDLDYELLIKNGVDYLSEYIDLNEINVIIAPQSSSPLVEDILFELEDRCSDQIVIVDSFFIKNMINNIEVDYSKLGNETALKSFNKQYANATSSGTFRIKDIKFVPFRRLIKNFLIVNDQVTEDVLLKINGGNVLLVDDVMTTNITMGEMNNILKQYEPKSVIGYCLIGN